MLTVINPATGEQVGEVETDNSLSVERRYRKARKAQPGWAALPIQERAETIRRFASALDRQVDSLAATQTQETGKPITQARNEIRATSSRITFFLDHLDSVGPETVLESTTLTERIEHEPLGVIANISAWNYPWFVGTNVFVPALLTGNAVLYKPSEHAVNTGLAMGRLLHEAGVPEDIFQVVVGAGAVGSALLEHPLDGVFFTGSYATGVKIAEAAARHLMKVQLELGGKDPAYAAEDVDPESVASGLADGAFYNTGQSCCAVERIYVHADVYDAFVDHYATAVRGFAAGDPTQDETYIGPLCRQAQLDVLEQQVKDAVGKGARVLVGGQKAEGPGFFFEPTVLVDVNHTMDVMKEESFGPIIGIQKVSSDDEAASLMNDSQYGLTAAVYTKDKTRAEAVLRQVSSGSSYWNCCDRVSPRLPWSGRGHSGVGLTLSTHGILTFTRPRAWHMRAPA